MKRHMHQAAYAQWHGSSVVYEIDSNKEGAQSELIRVKYAWRFRYLNRRLGIWRFFSKANWVC